MRCSRAVEAVKRAGAAMMITGLLAAAGLAPGYARSAEKIVVGSKAFTEGYVLGEIAAQAVEAVEAAPVTRK
ncbi:MAG TPA: hypothetical protein VN815_07665, partial [Steroidobacteraceae bacterium]|nr:hypothetical protein [Steroidobacteraceae bacterium]